LEVQEASPHRVRAWRAGASAVRTHPRPLADVFRGAGRAGLEAIDHIGIRLSKVIIEILRRGRSEALDRLRGEVGPTEVLSSVPGIGEVLAERIHHELGVDTLEQLEAAAHDGRLEALEGFGPRRVRAIQELLAARLSRAARRRASSRPHARPPDVALLLEEDRRYRDAARADRLRRIAPRRFNPSGEAWLPILHEDRGPWSFTVLFSNTALAHQLHKTHDWVVIYWESDHGSGRATVVTEWRGADAGRRVVRGREAECAQWWSERRRAQDS
ncbi:MAG: DNA-binding protein, partial [Myxococcales bacterium]|nr:DNA-binding protein [Myxococcales bacterium]